MCVIVTLKQIADLSGVSRGTVDRVLNHRGGVSEKTAQRVLQIAQTLHYSPSAAGKALAATKKSIHLGMLMLSGQNDNNPFIHEMTACARSKAAQLAEYGVTVDILHSPIGDCAAQLACIDRLLEQGITGLAIMPVNAPEIAQKLRQLHQLEIPVITFNSDIEDAQRLAYVGSNYYRAGQTAAGLMGLMTGGHARIGIVSGSPDVLCHTQRIAGFLDAAGEKYPEFEILSPLYSRDDDLESYRQTLSLLTRCPQTDTLYLTAGGVAGCCRAVRELGLAGKLKIISFDDVPTTKQYVREGVIMATITQQPMVQATKPLDLLFGLLGLEQPVAQEYYYTENTIKIAENLDDL